MAEMSAPWTGTTVGDAGAYGADDWSLLWSHICGFDADAANIGVCRAIENELEVTATTPASQQITVATGAALIQGKWYYQDAAQNFTIAGNGLGGNRLDLVVLQIDYVLQTVRLEILQGTVINIEPTPTQVAGTLWEVPLALITVASPLVSITAADIEDRRDWCNIPNALGLQIENNSAIVYEKGTVVVHNSPLAGYPLDTTTTTTAGDEEIAGVVIAPIAIGAAGRIITYGITPVLCDELVAVGDYLETSTTAGEAQAYASNEAHCLFARVLVANTGANTKCLALVDLAQFRNLSWLTTISTTLQIVDITTLTTYGWASGAYVGSYSRVNTVFNAGHIRTPTNFRSLKKAAVSYIIKAHNAGAPTFGADFSYAPNGSDKDTNTGTVTSAAFGAGDVDKILTLNVIGGLASLAADSGIGVKTYCNNAGDTGNHTFALAITLEFVASDV